MKYYFIINPNSGKVKKIEIEEKIRKACLLREIPYEILYTKKAGDARAIAKNIPDDKKCVVF